MFWQYILSELLNDTLPGIYSDSLSVALFLTCYLAYVLTCYLFRCSLHGFGFGVSRLKPRQLLAMLFLCTSLADVALCALCSLCAFLGVHVCSPLSLSLAQQPLLKSRHLHQAGGELENYTQGKICTVSDKVHAQLLGTQSHHLSKLGKRHLSKELGLTPRVVSGKRINANAFLINANAASIREIGFVAD